MTELARELLEGWENWHGSCQKERVGMGVIGRRRESVQELLEERELEWRMGAGVIGSMRELAWELLEGENWDGSYQKERIGMGVIGRRELGWELSKGENWQESYRKERIGMGVIGRRRELAWELSEGPSSQCLRSRVVTHDLCGRQYRCNQMAK